MAETGSGTATATTKVVMTTASFKTGRFELYPNPTNGAFKCEFVSEGDAVYHLTAADVTGRVVFETDIEAVDGANVANVTLPSTISRPTILFVTMGNSKKKFSTVKVTVGE